MAPQLIYRPFVAPWWTNELKNLASEKDGKKKNLMGISSMGGGMIEQRISVYGKGTTLRK